MNKSELIKDMQRFTGCGFITRNQLMKYKGKRDPHAIDMFLVGLDKIGKDYFIPDVAEKLLSYRTVR